MNRPLELSRCACWPAGHAAFSLSTNRNERSKRKSSTSALLVFSRTWNSGGTVSSPISCLLQIAQLRPRGRIEPAVEPGWNEFQPVHRALREGTVRQSDKNSDVLRAAAWSACCGNVGLNPNLMRQNQKRVAGAIEFLRLTPYEGPDLRFA